MKRTRSPLVARVVAARAAWVGLAALLAVTACGSPTASAPTVSADVAADVATDAAADLAPNVAVDAVVEAGEVREFPPAPVAPTGPATPDVEEALEAIIGRGEFDQVGVIGASGDVRYAWILSDLLRFLRQSVAHDQVRMAYTELTGVELGVITAWHVSTNQLIAWDIPAPPDYVEWKRRVFVQIEPGWNEFFDDAEATIDWRHVSWGGVLIDDRPLSEVGRPCPEGCIPAIDDPQVTSAADGDWYPDDAIIFGIEVNGESRAYPKNIMEVHEMTNDMLGGRRIALPYCTLCGSAQAYFTDDILAATEAGIDVPNGAYELRTSGLLIRSNKVMYEFHTRSVFDTFTGEAVSGPLRAADVQLSELTVVTTSWGDWKATHPATTILAENRPWGGGYPEDPLRGRDDDGPIFPVGDVDARLTVQEPVVGVIAPDGTPIAFPVSAARALLQAQEPVSQGGVRLRLDGAGVRAELDDGSPIASHQAFWFAWSQFHPETELWLPET